MVVSRREDIDNATWADGDFAGLSPLAKLGYLWSFTNPICGMAGLYKCRPGQLAFELGIDQEQELAVWEELSRASFAFYEDGVVFVRTRVKHLRTRGENMAKSIAADVAKIDVEHPLRIRFLETYGSTSWLASKLEPLEGFSGTLPTSLGQAKSSNPSEGSSATATASAGEAVRAEDSGTTTTVVAGASEDDMRIFVAWKEVTDRNGTTALTEDRLGYIQRAREHSSTDEIVEAIRHWELSDFHNGTKYGKPYTELRFLLKDRETIEELLRARDPMEALVYENPDDAPF